MTFEEKLARIVELNAQKVMIDAELRELLGETNADKPRRGRPRKEKGTDAEHPSLSLVEPHS
jgi:hypothetical protein